MMILPDLSASQRMKRTAATVTLVFSAAPSATVPNSSSAIGTEPVRRTRTPFSGVNPKRCAVLANEVRRLGTGLKIGIIQDRLHFEEASEVRWARSSAR